MERRKILLIDDSEITLAMEKAVLEARGYEVKATSTLVEFEKVLQSWKPDLILTDNMMPIADGKEFIRGLRSLEEYRNTPLVMMSSSPKHVALATGAGRAGQVGLALRQGGAGGVRQAAGGEQRAGEQRSQDRQPLHAAPERLRAARAV